MCRLHAMLGEWLSSAVNVTKNSSRFRKRRKLLGVIETAGRS